jgi:hypothetical protein
MGIPGDRVGVLLAFGRARGSWDINSERSVYKIDL